MPVPCVSVVIPTRNRLEALRIALAAFAEAEGSIDLVVVDDGSIDGTSDYLVRGESDRRWTYVRTAGRGPAAARNAGIRAARSEFIAMTDDDCLVPAGWAPRMRARLESEGADVVGGRVVADPGMPLPGRLSQAITNGFVKSAIGDAGPPFLTSNNVAYRRRALDEAGLFDEAFAAAGGEERELHDRVYARGGRLVYAPDIAIVHRTELDWRRFVRQQSAYGRGARLYYARGHRLGEHGPRRFSAGRYLRAFMTAARDVRAREWPALMLAVVLSQAAVLWGYFSREANQLD